ncbi:MAG: hypothetical protein JWN68_2002 [Nocardioides sp.]|jgi:hypothetical protein|uniref:DUF2505 domain-containing protein n=1 Tax=Nocardioides sp. TaxID=35761 RepID=UPI00260F4367|nr:DUF2505 domain-containing protein [Nocardioides sp.]MCW2834049.1 hypothetical protein [Nocardioides sp.]
MATQLHKELTYDASVEEVRAMLNDPAFREEVLEALHVIRGSVAVAGSRLTIEQVWSSDSLPSFARKFVGDEIVIVQEETWATDRADISVTIPGKPGDMSGTAVLEATAGGTVEQVDMTIKVGIPLVGGKIEKLIAEMLANALDKEHATGVKWLAKA